MAGVVVGIDGSDRSALALELARDEARLRDVALTAVVAWSYPAPAVLPVGAMPTPDELDAQGQAVLTATFDAVGITPDEVERRVVQGASGPALVEAAAGAELLVVGARGLGGFRSLLLGSVSEYCIQHGPCPVLVARAPIPADQALVVVGVDGSEGAQQALQAAADDAARRNAALEVVHCWRGAGAGGWPYPPSLVPMDELERAAQEVLDRAVHGMGSRHPGLVVSTSLVEGGAAGVLADISERADLIVVGSRGHGPLAGRLLGSVGTQLSHHSTCSLLVVPRPG